MGEFETLLKKLIRRELNATCKKINGYRKFVSYHTRIANKRYNMWIQRADMFCRYLDGDIIILFRDKPNL